MQDLHSVISICKITILKADLIKEKGEKVKIEGNLTHIQEKNHLEESFTREKM